MIIKVLFLSVSVISLLMQLRSAVLILQACHRPGLMRTACCRVGVAILYVALGTAALFTSIAATGVLALSVFSFTQCVWIVNSIADVRLAKKGRQGENKHRGFTHAIRPRAA